METTPTWQERFELTTCTAAEIEKLIPADALGVAVIYQEVADGGKTFLVIESRAKSLLAQCTTRLQTAKLPPAETLRVAFQAAPLADATPETLREVCRQQVYLAGELRRELRPAMR
ncbi:hypothetical protein [Oleiharenicola lentus]|uniref:hypothetical protein n=1 Tax=Oleiharenicola lentus TaxID=2508720 RepID=UPI003F681B00